MNSWLISGIILAVGLIICLLLIFRAKWKASRKNIDDYEVARDKLTFRKKPIPEQIKEVTGFSLSSIIGGFITILVGVSLLPTITEQINLASNTSNVTGATETLIQIVPVFFGLAIAVTAIGVVVGSLRSSGVV